MSRKIEVVQGIPVEQIKYTHSAAVTAGDVIFVAKFGALVAHDSYAISTEGIYYKAGRFRGDIASSVTIAQGDKLYYDVSTSTIRKSNDTTLIEGDFYLGVAAEAGTATAGYVVFYLNQDSYPVDRNGWKTFAASATLTLAESFCKMNGAAAVVTLTLPAAATSIDKEYWFLATSVANALTIDPNGSEVIGPGSATTFALSSVGTMVHIKSDGTKWNILEHYPAAYTHRAIIAVENLAAGVDIADRSVFIVPDAAATISSIGILTQGAPAGVDDSNTSVIALKDDAGNTIVTKTYNTATQPPTSDYESLGTVSGTHGVLAAGEHVTLSITNGATADLTALSVIITYTV